VVVVDASAVLDILLNPLEHERLRERLFRSEMHAPHLIDLEVLQVLRRYTLTREMADERAQAAIVIYRALPIERHSHEVLMQRVWELRSNLTAYDAAYVALAELLGAPLVTTDRRLAKSAPKIAEFIP